MLECTFLRYLLLLLLSSVKIASRRLEFAAPVTVVASVTRHLSRAVIKHEGVHEDVPIVGEPTKLVSFGTKASGRLNELRPLRVKNLLRPVIAMHHG